jgi:hypothetical protein
MEHQLRGILPTPAAPGRHQFINGRSQRGYTEFVTDSLGVAPASGLLSALRPAWSETTFICDSFTTLITSLPKTLFFAQANQIDVPIPQHA